MGYSRVTFSCPTSEFSHRKNKRGYEFKLCPYSSAYVDKYAFDGVIYDGFDGDNNPIKRRGIFVLGNSTDNDLYGVELSSYSYTEHTVTSGRMEQIMNPPGWICLDPTCWFYTTYGKFYKEV
jgi:hypothetical protein